MYNKVTPEIIGLLASIVGPANIIYNDHEKMESYSHDEIFEFGYSSMPEVVIKPESADEISLIMKLANEKMIPVTPRGAGSGLSGGAVPLFGGFLLSLERMNKILEIDKGNLMVVVEPGVITNDINLALQSEGLFYAGYPLSLQNCFIGGNVAENAGGARAVKYGVTGRYVCGLEVVLPTGEIINLGGKRLKDVTGYDLLNLLVGSEGTLGIFTKVILRALPLPASSVLLLIPFKDIETPVKTAPLVMMETGIIPAAIELMDRKSIEMSSRLLKEKVPCQDEAESYLLLEIDGSSEQVEQDYNAVADHFLKYGALDVFVANTPSTRERFWSIRRGVSDALKVFYPGNIAEDLVVPTTAIPALIDEVNRLSIEFNLESNSFGHLGDGNIHVHLLPNKEMPQDEWEKATSSLLKKLYQTSQQLGGTLSGEHGIGHKRKNYMPFFMGETEIALMKRIKAAFDPNNILNPGKIFD
ncbi:MAG: FAD-linked oxidase C-terminal domain-containing protein [Bacillota bacterium]|nr:FAD-linked oxidase C-terminal domain-containing protein [Bacillota bacterium]